MSREALLALDRATKSYRDGDRRTVAVQETTLDVPRGVFWALRGPSGSGKTTLLAMLGAMIQPTSGEVRLAGQPISRMRDRHRVELRRAQIGFVFQGLGLIPTMDALDNVLVPLVPLGGGTAKDEARALSLLEGLGLADKAHRRSAQLSGGERQRVAIARALLLDPPVLLLDEPTAHLDRARAEEITGHLAALRDEGRTIVVTTHDPRLADDARVDRVLEMDDGALRRSE